MAPCIIWLNVSIWNGHPWAQFFLKKSSSTKKTSQDLTKVLYSVFCGNLFKIYPIAWYFSPRFARILHLQKFWVSKTLVTTTVSLLVLSVLAQKCWVDWADEFFVLEFFKCYKAFIKAYLKNGSNLWPLFNRPPGLTYWATPPPPQKKLFFFFFFFSFFFWNLP